MNMLKNCLLFLCILMPGFILAQDFNPKTVVPAKLAKFDFGMPMQTFKEKNKTAVESPYTENDFRIEFTDVNAGSDYNSVIYYFDNEKNKPLYEMIIEFKSEKLLNDYCNSKLKSPNDNEKWKWTTKEGIVFKAWTFRKKLVFVLALPSTEWEEN
jgi:hypothetical protein